MLYVTCLDAADGRRERSPIDSISNAAVSDDAAARTAASTDATIPDAILALIMNLYRRLYDFRSSQRYVMEKSSM